MHAIFLSACIPLRKTSAVRPLGCYQLAWYLRQHNYECQVIDFVYALSEDEIIQLVAKFVTAETKFIGMGFMIDFGHVLAGPIAHKIGNVLRKLKAMYPEIKILVGGSTAFMWSEKIRNKTLFDYVIKGYAENCTLALFDHYYKGTPHPRFEIIDGNRHITEDAIPKEDQLFNIEQSRHTWHDSDCVQPGEALPIEFARGCMFKCHFCRYPHIGKHKNDYNRSMECVKQELIDNYNKFGVSNYYVTDDTFNADDDRVIQFTKMTRELPFKVTYGAFLRGDLLQAKPAITEMLAESGLVSTYLGFETFDPQAAKLISKPWSGKHAKEYLVELYHKVWNKQVHITAGMIAGIPPETLDDHRATNQFFVDNDIPTWRWHGLNIKQPFGDHVASEFDLNAEKYGFAWKIKDGRTICTQTLVMQILPEIGQLFCLQNHQNIKL
jgi:radical SAM superfamily enzyme YgiQ (UPF0313 family)